MVLSQDHKYEYCYQLSIWWHDLKELAHVLAPFKDDKGDHAVIRKTKDDKYAIFIKGGNIDTRYQLEVELRAKVIAPA